MSDEHNMAEDTMNNTLQRMKSHCTKVHKRGACVDCGICKNCHRRAPIAHVFRTSAMLREVRLQAAMSRIKDLEIIQLMKEKEYKFDRMLSMNSETRRWGLRAGFFNR